MGEEFDLSYLAWERPDKTCLAPERLQSTLLLVVLDDFVPAVEKPDEFDNPFEQLTRRPPRRTASTKRVVRERESEWGLSRVQRGVRYLKITISRGHDSASAATKIAMLRTAHSKVSHVRDWVAFY